MKLKTKELTTCALFAALIAIGAFIKVDIPLPMYTMHFTFQWFFVLMAGFLLGAKLATVSVIVYLSIGLVGVPGICCRRWTCIHFQTRVWILTWFYTGSICHWYYYRKSRKKS